MRSERNAEDIAMLKGDRGSKPLCILRGDAEGFVGDVPGRHMSIRQFEGQSDSNAATARSNVEDVCIGVIRNFTDIPCLSV